MTHNTFLAVIGKTARVKICDAIDVLEELYAQAASSDDAIDEYFKIYDLVDTIFQNNNFIGDSNDYHNIAVVCAKQEDFDTACRFLDHGLQQYPYDVDLLADYLKYGMKCNKKDECEKAYQNLFARKQDWNWRAYKFSIDYLIELVSIDSIDRDESITSLIADFQTDLPDEEDAYLVEAEYLQSRNNRRDKGIQSERTFISILQFATSDESPVKRTPKCDLKLADFYYTNGTNLERALELLERCKKDSVEIQRSVNRNYVFLLSALCKMSQYYDNKNQCNQENAEALVRAVYQDFHVAALDIADSRVRDCKKLIESFVRETQIPYPFDDGVANMIY